MILLSYNYWKKIAIFLINQNYFKITIIIITNYKNILSKDKDSHSSLFPKLNLYISNYAFRYKFYILVEYCSTII